MYSDLQILRRCLLWILTARWLTCSRTGSDSRLNIQFEIRIISWTRVGSKCFILKLTSSMGSIVLYKHCNNQWGIVRRPERVFVMLENGVNHFFCSDLSKGCEKYRIHELFIQQFVELQLG